MFEKRVWGEKEGGNVVFVVIFIFFLCLSFVKFEWLGIFGLLDIDWVIVDISCVEYVNFWDVGF